MRPLVTLRIPAALRAIASALIIAIPFTAFGQEALPVAAPSEPAPVWLMQTKTDMQDGVRVTVVEVDGTKISGLVTSITSNSVHLTVRYGQPSVIIPFSQIAKVDKKSLHGNALTIVVALSLAATAGLVYLILHFK